MALEYLNSGWAYEQLCRGVPSYHRVKTFCGVCDDEMNCQYAYFALHNWLFLRAQESVSKTACTAQFPVMLLRDQNTADSHQRLFSSPLALLEQHRHLVNGRAQLYSYEGICTFGVIFPFVAVTLCHCYNWVYVLFCGECYLALW